MDIAKTLRLAWENRNQIAEGLYNTYIEHKPEIEEEGKRRRSICESNVCGLYDKEGKAETSAIPGRPACTFCACVIELKTNCLSCYCSLGDKEVPGDKLQMDKALWLPITDNEIEKEIRVTEWNKQHNINGKISK